jgi:hypothetical protein
LFVNIATRNPICCRYGALDLLEASLGDASARREHGAQRVDRARDVHPSHAHGKHASSETHSNGFKDYIYPLQTPP